MECDRSVETDMLLTNGAYAVYSSRPILHTLLMYRYRRSVTNQPTPGFFTNATTPPQAVWAYSSGCSLRGPLTCATSIHRLPPCWLSPPKRPTSSVLASNNRERSQTAQPWTSLHCGERPIVLPGDASWKRLCSSSVPPDDDDDETAVGDIHQPFFYRYNTFKNSTALMSMLSSGVGARIWASFGTSFLY